MADRNDRARAELAKVLRRARARAGVSRQVIAERTGVSVRSAAAYESGETEPRMAIVLAWLAACGRTVDDLRLVDAALD